MTTDELGSPNPNHFPKTLSYLTKAADIPQLDRRGRVKFKSAFSITINAYSPAWKLLGRYKFTFTPTDVEAFKKQVNVLSKFLTKFKGNDNLVATIKPVTIRGPRASLGSVSQFNGIIVRPLGWDAQSDEIIELFNKHKQSNNNSAWRGMTKDEFSATVAKGIGVKSIGKYSLKGEKTQFSDDPSDAESYINFGRDDPRKTGKTTYLIEVEKKYLKRKPDGYWEGDVPQNGIVAIWVFKPNNGDLVMYTL